MVNRKATTQPKYGFLFNHDDVHQVAHIAPIMAALRKIDSGSTISALVSSAAQAETIKKMLGADDGLNLDIQLLKLPVLLRWALSPLNKIIPAQRVFILKRFSEYFSTFDCLIVPEMTSTLLKTRFNMKNTPLILLPHGAGDRAVGFGPQIRHFDFVLLAGSKVRDRMLRNHLIRPDNHQIVGYPKFDAVNLGRHERKQFFDNNNLTVLYNPHFDARLSSWYKFGEDILQFFLERPHLNLIFAPHVMLFKKKAHISLQSQTVRFTKPIPAKYFNCPNIHIDKGSPCSVDMSYTLSADVYLGDVSSQVYEFLTKLRPCIFLNSHESAWENDENYQHWRLGPVIDSLSCLEALLSSHPVAFHDQFLNQQYEAIRETFDLKESSASVRAAEAVFKFIQKTSAAKNSLPKSISPPISTNDELDPRVAGLLN